MSQARQTRHFARSVRQGEDFSPPLSLALCKMPRSPHLAYKVPVMQANIVSAGGNPVVD